MNNSQPSPIRYAHTNLVARDWRAMRDFYVEVFDCEAIGAVRDRAGGAVEALTGIRSIRVTGQHVRLPGHGAGGPTLEIFQFDPAEPAAATALNRPGFAHVAFEVPDVQAKRCEVVQRGGRDLGRQVTLDIEAAGRLTLLYMTDPEGNIIELQHWDRE